MLYKIYQESETRPKFSCLKFKWGLTRNLVLDRKHQWIESKFKANWNFKWRDIVVIRNLKLVLTFSIITIADSWLKEIFREREWRILNISAIECWLSSKCTFGNYARVPLPLVISEFIQKFVYSSLNFEYRYNIFIYTVNYLVAAKYIFSTK